jgi:hypothetical protein
VEDASGCQFKVHEYERRKWFMRTRRYVLDSGEAVRRVDETTFVIAATGETLLRSDDT